MGNACHGKDEITALYSTVQTSALSSTENYSSTQNDYGYIYDQSTIAYVPTQAYMSIWQTAASLLFVANNPIRYPPSIINNQSSWTIKTKQIENTAQIQSTERHWL